MKNMKKSILVYIDIKQYEFFQNQPKSFNMSGFIRTAITKELMKMDGVIIEEIVEKEEIVSGHPKVPEGFERVFDSHGLDKIVPSSTANNIKIDEDKGEVVNLIKKFYKSGIRDIEKYLNKNFLKILTKEEIESELEILKNEEVQNAINS